MQVAKLCVDENDDFGLKVDSNYDKNSSILQSNSDLVNAASEYEKYSDIYDLALIFESKNRKEFLENVQRVISRFGFRHFSIELYWMAAIGKPLKDLFTNYPSSWNNLYTNRNYASNDLASAQCLKVRNPIYWDKTNYANAGCIQIYETAKQYGISAGVSTAVRQYGGSTTTVTLTLDDSAERSREEQLKFMRIVQVLAGCIHSSAGKHSDQEYSESNLPKLTIREMECLQWVAAGKTAWEISKILGVVEATATFHVKNAIKKLNASNRQHALAIAFHYGLLR